MRNIILLLDYDGVLNLKAKFSEVYSKTFGIEIENMYPMFKDMAETATIGKGSLIDVIDRHKDEISWCKSSQELVDFWLKSDTSLDTRFIKIFKHLKKSRIKIYLATDQEKFRADYIWSEFLDKYFDGKFISCDIGFTKNNPKFFEEVISILKCNPQDIIFFDDSLEKVESAISVGIEAYHFVNFDEFLKIIENSCFNPI